MSRRSSGQLRVNNAAIETLARAGCLDAFQFSQPALFVRIARIRSGGGTARECSRFVTRRTPMACMIV